MAWETVQRSSHQPDGWLRFVRIFLGAFLGALALGGLFILLVDPYDVVPFSLPIERPLVEGNQRLAYPRLIKSKRFDSIIIGSSTARSLDPEALNGPFGTRFANLAIAGGRAGEQIAMVDYYLRTAGAPKVVIVNLDFFWCDPDADRKGFWHTDFPYWIYDDNRWNDYAHLFNTNTLEIAGRIVGANLGLHRSQYRADGFALFTPPDAQYDLEHARKQIRGAPADGLPSITASGDGGSGMKFPALDLLAPVLARIPSSSRKILLFLPMHAAIQGRPGTLQGAIVAACKARVVSLATAHGAQVIDWLIESPVTTDDSNYWDPMHFRVGVARQVERGLIDAVVGSTDAADGTYRLLVR
jgi:hypothetical protein